MILFNVETKHLPDGSVSVEVRSAETGEIVTVLRAERGPADSDRRLDAFSVELWTRYGDQQVKRDLDAEIVTMQTRRFRATAPRAT